MQTDPRIVGRNIERLRRAYGERQVDLGRAIHVSGSAVSNYEGGTRISPQLIEPIMDLKIDHLGSDNTSLLHLNELLIALAIAAVTDPAAKAAIDQLENLRGLEVHSSVILSQIDEGVFKKLGVNLTCEPQYESNKLYHK